MSNIISIVLIVASIGLFFGYADPAYTEIQKLRLEKADYDKALDNSKELQAQRDKLLEKFNAMEKTDLDKLAKLLPDNIDNVRLIIDIDEMAKAYGMRIRNFKTDANEKKDTIGKDNTPYGTLTLSFSTTAAYNTFLAFLRDVEHSLRVINVTAVQFASNDTGPLYDYNVTVKTYWLK
ncbi:type 4a pilus biogenesis protein PilO [Candidatus Parcubacteria bacterium]|nr:type 4a pilus biogenesis protein PilO [Candidatus Parcubacteria bacterium]